MTLALVLMTLALVLTATVALAYASWRAMEKGR